MRRDQQEVRVIPEGSLRPVSVMHIEVYNGDAVHLMRCPGMLGGNGCVAEQAESHGLAWFGMMAWWPHGTEGIPSFSGHDSIHGRTGGPCRPERSLARIR